MAAVYIICSRHFGGCSLVLILFPYRVHMGNVLYLVYQFHSRLPLYIVRIDGETLFTPSGRHKMPRRTQFIRISLPLYGLKKPVGLIPLPGILAVNNPLHRDTMWMWTSSDDRLSASFRRKHGYPLPSNKKHHPRNVKPLARDKNKSPLTLCLDLVRKYDIVKRLATQQQKLPNKVFNVLLFLVCKLP